ncbi:unnamed protein product [Calicophoron daubneyi]|uniref:Tetraspanin n=1 Tax=Calicophoron daubneyi TaxID=300641 RepID=A0AAV2TTA2_CALDB
MDAGSQSRRLNLLFLLHFLFVWTLCTTGVVCLTFAVRPLSEEFRDCPVLNTSFTSFWVETAVSVAQVTLATVMFIGLVIATCQAWRQSSPSVSLSATILQAAGNFGSLSQLHVSKTTTDVVAGGPWSGSPKLSNTSTDSTVLLQEFGPPRRLCCHTGCRTQAQVGWQKPVSIVLAFITVGHIVALILICNSKNQLSGPNGKFKSLVTNLFIEAKVQHTDVPHRRSVRRLSSEHCWEVIQRELRCCGPYGYLDWNQNYSRSVSSPKYKSNRTIPFSCICTDGGPEPCDGRAVIKTIQGPVYARGCIDPLTNVLNEYFLLLMASIPITIGCILITSLIDIIFTLKTANILLKQMKIHRITNISQLVDYP